MKKILKALGLLLVAAAMFAGCKKDADDEQKNIQEALFDPAELTLNASVLEFSDGRWIFRQIVEREDEDINGADQIEFTVSNNTFNTNESIPYISSVSGTIPDGTTEEEIEALKKEGYKINGNKYSAYVEYDLAELIKKAQTDAEFQERITTYSNKTSDGIDPEYAAYRNGTRTLNQLFSGNTPSGIKTNNDKSKYYYERHVTGKETFSEKTYLAKQ